MIKSVCSLCRFEFTMWSTMCLPRLSQLCGERSMIRSEYLAQCITLLRDEILYNIVFL